MADSEVPDSFGAVQCPVCSDKFQPATINAHLDNCLSGNDNPKLSTTDNEPPSKKSRISNEYPPCTSAVTPAGTDTKSSSTSSMFSMFQHKQKMSAKERDENTSNTQINDASTSTDKKPVSLSVRALLNTDKPLAEKLRPNTLEEYFGQNKVLGEHTLLRSLLQSQEVPSLILWGPPGCGKVTS